MRNIKSYLNILKFYLRIFVSILKGQKQIGANSVVDSWFRIDGDNTLRLEYKLDKDSIVFDLGGYVGDWTDKIHKRYGCNIYVFEPVKDFFYKIAARFIGNKQIFVYQFGLGNSTKNEIINLLDDGSSTIREGLATNQKTEEIVIKKASDFFIENNIKTIDLMKINIEGGEYDLLDHLIESGFIKNILNIQVQFHNFFPDAEKRMVGIQEKFSKTHKKTYSYRFVWENWTMSE